MSVAQHPVYGLHEPGPWPSRRDTTTERTVKHHEPLRKVEVPRRFDAKVVGVSYAAGYPAALLRLHALIDDGFATLPVVDLRRDAENPVDPNAVAVDIGDEHIGHLPAALAGRLGPAMDEGQVWEVCSYQVLVSARDPQRPGLSVTVRRVN